MSLPPAPSFGTTLAPRGRHHYLSAARCQEENSFIALSQGAMALGCLTFFGERTFYSIRYILRSSLENKSGRLIFLLQKENFIIDVLPNEVLQTDFS